GRRKAPQKLRIMETPLAPALLRQWRHWHLLSADDWGRTPVEVREELARAPDRDSLLTGLVVRGLLTPYQAGRLRDGSVFGLVLGNYRVLERHLSARDSDLVQARNALVLALAKLAEYRDTETGAHLLRLQSFSRRLAEAAAR